MKIRFNFPPALLFVCLCTACGGHNPKALKAGPDEVVVVGRIHAYEQGVEVSPEIQFLFNESIATFYRTFAPKDSGHFVLRLPRGYNWITRMEYRGRSVTFPRDYAVLDLSDAETIHYVGDIRVVFAFAHMEPTGGGAAGLGAVGGAVGAAAGLALQQVARDLQGPSDVLPVIFEVSSDPEAAREFLRRTYKVDGALTQSLLEARTGPKVEEEVLETGEESEEPE